MARETFHHPFQPYDIQLQLMRAVYDCIEDGKVGIFESPTGTGKSLSLICASLTWLREHKRKEFDTSLANVEADDGDPAWMVEHARKARLEELMRSRAEFEKRLAKIRAREDQMRTASRQHVPQQKKLRTATLQQNDDSDEAFVLDDYDSDDNQSTGPERSSTFSARTEQMLAQLGMLQPQPEERSLEDSGEFVKVYICSRTHSQLSQFVGELQRVKLPAGLPSLSTDLTTATEVDDSLKQLSLGSRKNLCINPSVQRLGTQTAINERCLELQASGKDKERCSFALKHDKPEQVLDFRDHALANIRDIEDLASVGKELKICPYYASRSTLASAEVVMLPYPLLLQRAARESMGISLKGCVVIIDEAHNLMDAVESACSSQVSAQQLLVARTALMTYLQRFRTRLKGSNRTYVAQVIRVIDSLNSAMQSFTEPSGITTPETLLNGKHVDQINLSKLVRYISESKLARKVNGYADFLKKDNSRKNGELESAVAKDTPTLTVIQQFLSTAANPSKEGRFFWHRESNGIVLKYVLLDPSSHFRDIVEDARAVILAGGTMSPMNDHISQLFPYLADIRTLSCAHIVPPSSIFVRAIGADRSGTFEFTYKTRSDVQLVKRLGTQLVNIAKVVKGGMVVFFASYAYLGFVQNQWTSDGTMKQLQSVKATFFDGRNQPAERTFQQYSNAVHDGQQSALLFSVIGGKLSEGINFSDDLGRCVVVVGMPYPNLESPEWKAKLEYLQSRPAANERASQSNMSQDFAENICMRAVNQAVGRAIRHIGDWASILLIDMRYTRPRIQSKLPAWIRGSLPSSEQLATSHMVIEEELQAFFKARHSR